MDAGILCYEMGMSGRDMGSCICHTVNTHLHAVWHGAHRWWHERCACLSASSSEQGGATTVSGGEKCLPQLQQSTAASPMLQHCHAGVDPCYFLLWGTDVTAELETEGMCLMPKAWDLASLAHKGYPARSGSHPLLPYLLSSVDVSGAYWWCSKRK